MADDKKYVIEHDIAGCIGCGACASINPNNWIMKGTKSHLIKKDITKPELQDNMDAAESCPVNVIHIKEISKDKDNKDIEKDLI